MGKGIQQACCPNKDGAKRRASSDKTSKAASNEKWTKASRALAVKPGDGEAGGRRAGDRRLSSVHQRDSTTDAGDGWMA
jgi:hypothetical protein